MVPLDSRFGGRLYAAGLLAAVVALFTVAAGLHPHGAGLGVHQQLGLPPCGFVTMTGLPCPTCGMTTAFAYTVHGHWLAAARAQAAGFLLALATVAAGLFALVALCTARRPALNWYRINPASMVWIGSGLFVAAWAVKIVLFLLDDGPGNRIRF